MTFDKMLRGTSQNPIDLAAFDSVEGWMSNEAADLSIRLGQLQRATNAVTGVLELGIFRGKYFSLLAKTFQGLGIPLVGVDAFIIKIGEMVPEEIQTLVRMQVTETLMRLAPQSEVPTLLTGWTKDIEPQTLRSLSPVGYSFISIDAGHEAPDVEHDFGLAEVAMSERAVIAADDVFNFKVPGVFEGMSHYFFKNPQTQLAPFACCGNKVFLCRADSHELYCSFSKWLLDNVHDQSYVRKTVAIQKDNNRAGFRPMLFGHEVVAFDWN